jgi:phosphoglycerate kinase
MMNLDKLKTAAGVYVKGKRVLVRADLNVPLKDGKVTDATRLERLLPGLRDLADRGAKVIVISHFGISLSAMLFPRRIVRMPRRRPSRT